MESKEWVLLTKAVSQAESEIMRGMLEAQEIEVLLAQEGAAKAIGLSVGSLGEIQVHVKREDEERARQIVEEFRTE